MNKMLLLLTLCFIMLYGSSCQKTCGHCINANGQKEASVCKNASFSATGLDSYDQAELNCKNNGGTWQVD